MAEPINLTYQLPSAVDYIRKGWLTSCQTAAIVSGLFTAASVLLLTFIKDPADSAKHANSTTTALLFFASYSAIVFNASAAITSIILIDKLGDLPARAARNVMLQSEGPIDANDDYLLKRYRVGGAWPWVMWHWFICLQAGIWCIIIQVLSYIWLQESLAVRIAMTCVVALTSLPLALFIPSGCFGCRGKEHPPIQKFETTQMPETSDVNQEEDSASARSIRLSRTFASSATWV